MPKKEHQNIRSQLRNNDHFIPRLRLSVRSGSQNACMQPFPGFQKKKNLSQQQLRLSRKDRIHNCPIPLRHTVIRAIGLQAEAMRADLSVWTVFISVLKHPIERRLLSRSTLLSRSNIAAALFPL
jgi:hypothetical protein